jgi:sec-independent protein translocase protein TatC
MLLLYEASVFSVGRVEKMRRAKRVAAGLEP